MAHAYIICGPDGVGKSAFAWEMMKAILCRKPRKNGEACGLCPSCRKLKSGNHPEVAVIERESGRQSILVEQVEALREEWFCLQPVEGDRKICLVCEADRMNDEVANRLLKILEEPSGETVFLLTTSRPEALLETILSRCQTVRLRSVSEKEIVDHLLETRSDLSREQAEMAAKLAEGSPGRAMELLDGDLLERTRWALGLISELTSENMVQVMAELKEYSARRGREKLEHSRQRLALVLEALLLNWKDQLIAAEIGEPANGRDFTANGRPLAAWQLERLIDIVFEAERRLLANVNLSLLLQTMLTKMAKILDAGAPTKS